MKNFMPGAGVRLWQQIRFFDEWTNPLPRESVLPNVNQWSARYYRAIDAINRGERELCFCCGKNVRSGHNVRGQSLKVFP